MDDFVLKLGPYAAVISAAASIAAFTFLVHLLNLIRNALNEQLNAIREQKGIEEARRQKAEEDLERTEKWHQRELEGLQRKLASFVVDQDITVEQLVATGGKLEVGEDVKETLAGLLLAIGEVKSVLVPKSRASLPDGKDSLDMAQALYASGDWLAAAHFYGEYLKAEPRNWEVHFVQAIAYANSRAGADAYRQAFLSLNAAIVYAPPDLDRNMKARLMGYRGADLKRLGRLEEAESDLILARRWATNTYEVEDTTYNLAGVYAMMGRRQEMLENLRRIAAAPKWRAYIQQRQEYFATFWNDPEFRNLVGLPVRSTPLPVEGVSE